MKKLVSLIVSIMLVASVFCVSAVAFADEAETTARSVTFNADEFAKLDASNPQIVQSLDSSYLPDTEWLKDAETVQKVFEGANYILDDADDTPQYSVTSESDVVKFQYLEAGDDYKDDSKWTTATLGASISVDSEGWWGFRYLLCINGSEEDYDAKSSIVYIYFSDDMAPVFDSLSSAMETKQEEGIKVGSSYTISTSLSYTDDSSVTVTYIVYKKVGDSWIPVYDSVSGEVTSGYEDGISTSGVITMQKDDVLANNEPIYKIVYTLTDSMGYITAADSDGVEIAMTLFATEETTEISATEIIKIVLYCVAGAALIGIIVVLCIKPKQSSDDNE